MFFMNFLLVLAVAVEVVSAYNVKDLMAAVEANNIPMVEKISKFVLLTSCTDEYRSVLMTAAISSDITMMKFLLGRKNEIINEEDYEGYTALDLALITNKADLVDFLKELVKSGANITRRSNNRKQQSPLHLVKTASAAKYLIENKALKDEFNVYAQTPAVVAVANNRFGVLKELVEAGANLQKLGSRDNTIFHTDPVDPNVHIWTPEVISLLAKNGAPMNEARMCYCDDVFGHTPMTKALAHDIAAKTDLTYEKLDNSFYGLMFSNGADLDAPTKTKDRLIHIAAREWMVDFLKWLLDNGALVDPLNDLKETPLLAAVRIDQHNRRNIGEISNKTLSLDNVRRLKAVIDILVENEADTGALDKEGHNVLYYVDVNRIEDVLPDVVSSIRKQPEIRTKRRKRNARRTAT